MPFVLVNTRTLTANREPWPNFQVHFQYLVELLGHVGARRDNLIHLRCRGTGALGREAHFPILLKQL